VIGRGDGDRQRAVEPVEPTSYSVPGNSGR